MTVKELINELQKLSPREQLREVVSKEAGDGTEITAVYPSMDRVLGDVIVLASEGKDNE